VVDTEDIDDDVEDTLAIVGVIGNVESVVTFVLAATEELLAKDETLDDFPVEEFKPRAK
jgi:hypothetical protein